MAEPQAIDFEALTGHRRGPYNSFNPVSRTQVWQWCAAMGDRNPLYLDDAYRSGAGFDRVVAPPAMMQMWTMRDVNMELAPGSTPESAYAVFDALRERGFPANVAVSYDITFHRLLVEGDRAHHYSSIESISPLKQTAIGEGYFVTEHAQYYDQEQRLYAEARITYFQYRPAEREEATKDAGRPDAPPKPATDVARWQPDFRDLSVDDLTEGQDLPELVIPITHKLIVSCAIASQDFIDVHHNAPAARAAGMPDIFMNILSTCGLCARYLTDWAGPGSRLRRLSFRLLAPNTPGDTMILRGRVDTLAQQDGEAQATVSFAGENSRGFHVTGSATLALAG